MENGSSTMNTLFNILPELPEGFHYFPEFISEEEERHLVNLIPKYPLKNLIFQGYEAKRKVLSLGYDYHFDTRKLTEGLPIPDEFTPILNKVAKHLNIPADDIKEILLTEYGVGHVINWHRDAHLFEKIAGISLLSDCNFKLRPYDKSKQTKANTKSFVAERRSLYLMENEAKQHWEHSIAPVKSLRYSITFRTLKEH
jgi:alkylated DNA repair dioxygenase AlkB